MRLILKKIWIFYWFYMLAGLSLLLSNSAYSFEEDKCQVVKSKACIDFGKRMVDGIETKDECWRYEEQHYCLAPEKNNCSELEANRGCNELSNQCLEQSNIAELCQKTEKKFACGKEQSRNLEIKHIDTQFKTVRDEKDLSKCSAEEINQYCEVDDETCIEPKETRNINGKLIEKDCWKWKKQYVCHSSTIVDECKNLDKDCRLTGEKTCLHSLKVDGKDVCVHLESQVSCTSSQEYKKPCIATKFCIGDVCEQKTRTQHNDFANSISKLAILDSMKSDNLDGCKCPDGKETCDASEMDPGNCKLFSGNAKQCSKTQGRNCCKNKGSLKSIWDCNQEAKDLFVSRQAGLCHHVGSWKGKKVKDAAFLKKYESHCCFKSKMARILNVAGKEQLGIGWGDKKNPDCRPLTLEEIRRIDFSKVNFSDMFADIENNARSKISSAQENIKNKMNDLQENTAGMSEIINKKVNNFYKGVK